MGSSVRNLQYNNPSFDYSPGAKVLVLALHGSRQDHRAIAGLIEVIEETFGKGNVDIFAPTLPYSHARDGSGADKIVVDLVGDLDTIWEEKADGEYERVILIGHSLGGILARRVFLAGSLNPPDYSDGFETRDELWHAVATKRGKDKTLPCDWAPRVERLVLLASWDKGWSISDRTSWLYSFALNALGAWGRFTELAAPLVHAIPGLDELVQHFIGPNANSPARTLLDMRKGAPFVVQTRLLWMAYRRWHNPKLRAYYNQSHPVRHLEAPRQRQAANPLVVQIIGAQDNFVSPQDQVDRDAEAAVWQKGESQLYFLLQMMGSNHGQVIDFGSALGAKRKEVFVKALTLSPEMLADESINPTFFFDNKMQSEPEVKDVVFVMHGIRDDGYWTHRIAEEIKQIEAEQSTAGEGELPPAIVSCTPTYGYFPLGSFILPWIRRQKVEWFMDLYVEVRAKFPSARMHYVGHSNGTYLAAGALSRYPAVRFGNIYFAGSVVNRTFDWPGNVKEKRVEHFHNARGGEDWVVALGPKSLEYFTDLGGGGFDGFECSENGDTEQITRSDNFARGGHSGAIEEPHWPEIAKFIVTGAKPFGDGEKTGEHDPFMKEPISWIKTWSDLRFGIPVGFSLLALIVLLLFSLWLPFDNWRWSAFDFFKGPGYAVWAAALAAFLALQYLTPPTPRGWRAIVSTLLIVFCALGVANFFFTTLLREAAQFGWLGTSQYWVAFRTAAAAFTLAGSVAAIRFLLTRF